MIETARDTAKIRRRLARVSDLSKRIRQSDEKFRPARVEVWRELLEDLGVSVHEIAEACGVEPITIYKGIQRSRKQNGQSNGE